MTSNIETRQEAIQRIHNQLGWSYGKREDQADDEAQDGKVNWDEQVEKANATAQVCTDVSDKVASLEKAWTGCICVVFDFDAFSVNVALLNYPDLFKSKPVVICEGECAKTCCTVNYVGREYGIQKSMPFWMAQAMCRRAREFVCSQSLRPPVQKGPKTLRPGAPLLYAR